MDYVERYIYAVTRYLPEKDREDVAKELKSNIEDMLDDNYSKENVRKVLENMGSPYELSTRYLDQEKYLIGPRIYHTYIDTLKILFVVAVAVGGITFVIDLLANINSLDTITSLSDTISTMVGIIISGISIMFSVIMGFFFWVTLIFVILERTQATGEMKKIQVKPFSIEDLKEKPKPKDKRFSKVELAISIVLTIAFLFILLFRNDLLAIYISGEGAIEIFNSEVLRMYTPLILGVGALSITLSVYKLVTEVMTKKSAILISVYTVISLITMVSIVLEPNLFSREFVSFLSENLTRWSGSFEDNLYKLKIGFIVVIGIISIIEIVVSLFQGFQKENPIELKRKNKVKSN